MSRVVAIRHCRQCPHYIPYPYLKPWCERAEMTVEVTDTNDKQYFPLWCPLPEKEKEESDAKG